VPFELVGALLAAPQLARASKLSCAAVAFDSVNRAAARFILRIGSAGSKGSGDPAFAGRAQLTLNLTSQRHARDVAFELVGALLAAPQLARASALSCTAVAFDSVNRAAARFILRIGSAGSKGSGHPAFAGRA
jgi:hypothetical protein